MFVGSAIVLGILAMDRAEPEVTARGSVRRAADGTFMVDVAFDVHDAQKCRARNRVVVVTVPDLSSEAVEFACVAPEALEPLGPN
jgi:alanine dehydrogenase